MLGAPEPVADDAFGVWPENAASVELFCRCATQWNVVAGMAGLVHIGLRYEAVEPVMRMRRAKDRAALFDDLQVMEGAALAVLNANDG